MLKKTIKYTDYDGNTCSEVFYFNMSKNDVINLERSVEGGFSETLSKLNPEKDKLEIASLFVELIKMAYGEKSEDGKRFIKSAELSNNFIQTAAFEALFEELSSGTEETITAFVKDLLPKSN